MNSFKEATYLIIGLMEYLLSIGSFENKKLIRAVILMSDKCDELLASCKKEHAMIFQFRGLN